MIMGRFAARYETSVYSYLPGGKSAIQANSEFTITDDALFTQSASRSL